MAGHEDESRSLDEGVGRTMNFIEPTFEVGPPGVGPVMGIDGGEFFRPVTSDDEAVDDPAEGQREA